MTPLRWDRRPDGLRAPALVAAFKGWNDAGDAASAAVTFVGSALNARRFACMEPQDFFDLQTTRPQIKLREGRARDVEWPGVELYEARVPTAPRDLILVIGDEPALRWRDFCGVLLELGEALGAQLVVTLGALLADVAHSRPVGVSGLASDEALVERLSLSETSYEGPTGITGVLHVEASEAGFPAASLWAAVPHYVAASPNPKATLALVRRLERAVGVTVDASQLEQATEEYERQVDLAVQRDPEVRAFVEKLEKVAEEEEASAGMDPDSLPSGEVLAREFQRFLRQRGGPSRE